MKVGWITQGGLSYDETGRPTSDLASARYRIILPAEAMAPYGIHSKVVQVTLKTSETDFDWRAFDDVDVLVISKSFNPLNERIAARFRERGRPVVVDLCDDHFANEDGAHHRRLLELADLVVANTPWMARRIQEESGREAVVIPDPYEGERQVPRFRPEAGRLRLLWFGSDTQVTTITEFLPQLREGLRPHLQRLEVELVTNEREDLVAQLEGYNQFHAPYMALHYTPWDLGVVEEALARADAVVIPSRNETKYFAKSANRLLLSLWNGRFASAWPLPEYRQFSSWAYVGEDLVDGLVWAMEHQSEVEAGIASAQDYIAACFSPERVGDLWYEVLRDVINGRSGTAMAAPAVQPAADARTPEQTTGEAGLRLNLGCGDKILPGYVNVDVAFDRGGRRPDLVSDLHRLPLPDGCAEEILAVHVVEHFWRWEVVDVLREWVRLLKPGGRMILECPNLRSACEAFLADPEKGADPGPAGQRTMWVFYGDPRWQDPLMVHRWGYTPESLAQVMAEAGLSDIRQAPAQFKLREPRDMRLEGIRVYE